MYAGHLSLMKLCMPMNTYSRFSVSICKPVGYYQISAISYIDLLHHFLHETCIAEEVPVTLKTYFITIYTKGIINQCQLISRPD